MGQFVLVKYLILNWWGRLPGGGGIVAKRELEYGDGWLLDAGVGQANTQRQRMAGGLLSHLSKLQVRTGAWGRPF